MSLPTTTENTFDETTVFQDAATALSHGKRHLMVCDYSMAVTALAQACSKLAEDHGDMSDELGEPFLLYGRALLGLSREEAGVLGTCMPENENEDDDDDEDDDVKNEDPTDAENEIKEKDQSEEKQEKKESSEKKQDEAKEIKQNADEEVKVSEEKKQDDVKLEENKQEAKKSKEEEEKKSEEKQEKKKDDEPSDAQDASSSAPSSSKKDDLTDVSNGGPSTSKQNGTSENGEEEGSEDDEEEEANGNLQVAWEVLELAKLILVKRGKVGWKNLAEVHRLLGEVAMESGNQAGALVDLSACLDLLRKIEPVDARSIAETHYQLGLAYSLGNEFDSSIEQFTEASSLLETRIKELQSEVESTKTDQKSSEAEKEINELKELLPAIQDKIADMRDFKQQTAKLVIESIKSQMASGSCSNGAGPSGEGSSTSSAAASSSSSKPVSDISHLVRKKRKTEEEETDAPSPCKKPLTENSS